jgi:hypothetical protein
LIKLSRGFGNSLNRTVALTSNTNCRAKSRKFLASDSLSAASFMVFESAIGISFSHFI